jgi:hypothetical protein
MTGTVWPAIFVLASNKVSPVQLIQAGAVFMLNGVFAWLCGSLLTRGWLDAAEPVLAATCRRRLVRAAPFACILACVAGMGVIWSSFAAMAGLDLGDVGGAIAEIVIDTEAGRLIALAMVALLLAAIVHALPWPPAMALCLLLVFALTRAQISHAGGGPAVAVLADAVHL